MAIHKLEVHTTDYTIINRSVAEDCSLSFEARGVLVYLLSKPASWKPSVVELAKAGNCGKDRIRRILKELEGANYVKKLETRNQLGRFDIFEMHVFEVPVDDQKSAGIPQQKSAQLVSVKPQADNSVAAEPCTEKPYTVKPEPDNAEHSKYTEIVSTESSNTPLTPQGGKPRKRQQKFDPLTATIPDSVNPMAWREWWEYKGAKPVVQSVITKTANQFISLTGDQQQAMVDSSIANQYRGIFPDKFKTGNHNGTYQQKSRYRSIDDTLNNDLF